MVLWLCAGFMGGSMAARAFDVPRHVFPFERLSEAQQEAFTDKAPLLLLYADPKKVPT